jgi:hypothetical protein
MGCNGRYLECGIQLHGDVNGGLSLGDILLLVEPPHYPNKGGKEGVGQLDILSSLQ